MRILGRLLQTLLDKVPVEIADMKGGSAQNAIPREAYAVVVIDAAHEAELKKLVANIEAEYASGTRGVRSGPEDQRGEHVAAPAQVLDAGPTPFGWQTCSPPAARRARHES